MFTSTMTVLALLVAAPGAKDPPKKEQTIVGEWAHESVVAGGQVGPTTGMTITFTGDGTMTIKRADREKAEVVPYKIDPTKNLPQIDIPNERPKVPLLVGIFKVNGDSLTICFTPGGERPTEFRSSEGTTTALMYFRRVKKD